MSAGSPHLDENKNNLPDNQQVSSDVAFVSKVSSFFNKMIEDTNQLGRESDQPDDRDYYQTKYDKWGEFGIDLKTLCLPQSQKLVQDKPYLVAGALGSLVNMMSRNHQDSQNPEDQNSLELFNQSKSLFLDSCAKVFPDIKRLGGQSLDRQFQVISSSLSSVRDENLKLAVGNIASIGSPTLLMQGNPSQLIEKIESIITNAGNMIDNALWQKDIPQDLQKELAIFIREIYRLQLFLEDLKFKKNQNKEVQKRADEAVQIEDLRKKMNTPKGEQSLSFEKVKIILDPKKVETIEDIIKIVTPQVKAALLRYLLADIDYRIDVGKRLAAKDPRQIVEASRMVSVVGNSSATAPYQFIAIAGMRKFVSNRDIPQMKVYDYLKDFLGHDLNTDQARSSDLKKYTNMLS